MNFIRLRFCAKQLFACTWSQSLPVIAALSVTIACGGSAQQTAGNGSAGASGNIASGGNGVNGGSGGANAGSAGANGGSGGHATGGGGGAAIGGAAGSSGKAGAAAGGSGGMSGGSGGHATGGTGGGAAGRDGKGGSAGGGATGGTGGVAQAPTCPATAPVSAGSCAVNGQACFYEDCAGAGRTAATCNNGFWTVQEAACAAVQCIGLPSPTSCASGQSCSVTQSGTIGGMCTQPTCGKGPITCACAHASCENCSISGSVQQGITVTCNNCPQGGCA